MPKAKPRAIASPSPEQELTAGLVVPGDASKKLGAKAILKMVKIAISQKAIRNNGTWYRNYRNSVVVSDSYFRASLVSGFR